MRCRKYSKLKFFLMINLVYGVFYMNIVQAEDNMDKQIQSTSKSELVEVLTKNLKPTKTITFEDGSNILILPYGGRVLGLFAKGNEENFYWTNTALSSVNTAKDFYLSNEWHNSGGDRTWLSPEIDIFFPNFPNTEKYWQPRELDPGNYEVYEEGHELRLVNEMIIHFTRPDQSLKLRLTKSFGSAPQPLRYEKYIDMSSLEYAGYTQYTQLEIINGESADIPAVGLWNLVQMPHGGDMIIPTYDQAIPKIYFGDILPEDLLVTDHLIKYKMRAQGEQKIGIRAVTTTGRIGYCYRNGKIYNLIVRNISVNPSGEYVDVPWNNPDDLGYSTQACNINSKLGSFSELEYHIPAIGGSTRKRSCHDEAQVWAFRGSETIINEVSKCLLGVSIED